MRQSRSPVPAQTIEEASRWFVLMREASVSAQDHAAFAEWLRLSPVHVGTYLEIAKLWVDAANVDSAFDVALDDASTANVVALRDLADRYGDVAIKSGRYEKVWGAAASIALLAGAGMVWWTADRAHEYSTETGEQRVLTLEDGSTVRLNSRSRVSVRLTSQRRELELSAGQALFEVAQDPVRPFVVTSGDIAIRAVGTQFDVNRRSSGTVVTVVEGRVAIGSRQQPDTSGATVLGAGEQAKVAAAGAVERTMPVNARAATSWLQQELVFDGESLSEVVEELNRYSRTPIVFGDESLGHMRINAVFHTTSPESFLRYVARLEDVQVDRSAREIRLNKRADSRNGAAAH